MSGQTIIFWGLAMYLAGGLTFMAGALTKNTIVIGICFAIAAALVIWMLSQIGGLPHSIKLGLYNPIGIVPWM